MASESPSSFFSFKYTLRSPDPPQSGSAIVTDTECGSHVVRIIPYSLTKGIGIGKCIMSCTFTAGDHSWAVGYYPDGNTKEDAEYIALFVFLMNVASDVRAKFTCDVLDQDNNPVYSLKSEIRKFSSDTKSWGWGRFMKREKLESSGCLIDDSLTFRCVVMVIKEPCAKEGKIKSLVVPPTDLHQQFGNLLATGEGTDVMFAVNGETFAAHRCVLAARSSVFKAELFGSMKEKSMQCIQIDEMEAAVFKALLHFIYTDSLPEVEMSINSYATLSSSSASGSPCHMEEPSGIATNIAAGKVSMAEHLLVAADRYGLERLKIICEYKLSEEIDVNNVATALALAEQHHCEHLKTACLDLMFSRGKLKVIMGTEGFKHLKTSCPAILEELLKKASDLL